MDEELIKQVFDELLTSLEPLETQNAALLQFLKAKGLATEEEFAPFLEQAANTANIRWRAVRVRTAALISSAMKPDSSAALGSPNPAPPDRRSAQGAGPTSEEESWEKEDKSQKKNSQNPEDEKTADRLRSRQKEDQKEDQKGDQERDQKERPTKDPLRKESSPAAAEVSKSEDEDKKDKNKRENSNAKRTSVEEIPPNDSKEKAA
jgi:hypothetical protein